VPGDSNNLRTPPARMLVALTHDTTLVSALRELATDDLAIHIAPNLRALPDELLQHSSAVALLDAEALNIPVETAIDAIAKQFPDLCLMVAGHAAEQARLATRISSQRVFRFVHKPASPQRLKLFLDAAARTQDSHHGRPQQEMLPERGEPLAKLGAAVDRRSPQTVALIGVITLSAIAAGAYVFWPTGTPNTAPPAAAVTPATVPAAPASPQVLALIAQGDQAFAAARYVGIDGTSAVERYRDALKLDAQNANARRGFDRSVEFGLRAAEEALLASKLDDAATIAEALRLIAPDNAHLAFLNTQIGREQARLKADTSQRATIETRQRQIRSALTQMSERLNRGALLDPAANSAVAHFRQAAALGPGDVAVRDAREKLIAALLTTADGEITARRIPSARRHVDAAASLNSSAPGLDVLRRRLDEAAAQLAAANTEGAAQAARTAPAPAASTPAATPPPAAPAVNPVVATTPTATPSVVAATSLRVLRTQSPTYPQRALDELVSGWVEMEFTVARDGTVQNVVVINAEPKRTFDAAAVAAMRRYRYAPVVRNGEAIPQRARLRMRFAASEAR
jgi:periplasmic protein TonB